MRPQRITFGRMYPNAGYTAKYRRELRKMIRTMHEDTRREIRALYDDKTYDAPITLTQIMAKLREKWYKIFTKKAREMNRWLVETVKKRTRKDIMKQLKNIGMVLTPNYSASEKEMIDNIVTTGVDLIVTIPKTYFHEVQETVRDAVERGGDIDHTASTAYNVELHKIGIVFVLTEFSEDTCYILCRRRFDDL